MHMYFVYIICICTYIDVSVNVSIPLLYTPPSHLYVCYSTCSALYFQFNCPGFMYAHKLSNESSQCMLESVSILNMGTINANSFFFFFNRIYFRLYGIKCSKCNIGFSKNDFVMRARSKVYHIECFRCVACSRQLIPGDEFALREDGLFCRADHDVVERATMGAGDPLSPLHPARPLQMAGMLRMLSHQ